jgi:prevent-host-death family protein
MKRASISEAKNRLSAYVDRVRGGETILITDRGRPVARLAPLEPGTQAHQDARLAELVRRGIIRVGRKAPPRRLPTPVKLRKRIDATRLIAEDREAR